ncbi:MAG: 50S ribosomal protein L11 methyltransferase [Caldilineaceae bacterium]
MPQSTPNSGEIIELSVAVDSEAAEAVSELFNRYNGGGYEEDSEAGEASGGGAVIEATGFDDDEQTFDGAHRFVVKTYIKPGQRGEEIHRQIEEGLWRLSLIYPVPATPEVRTVREEDWANAWKKFYKPLRVGRHVVLKPSWEEFVSQPDDIIIELDPGMAFGTGLHPTTRLCIAALEEVVQKGDAVLDVGTGSGVLAIVAAKLGATEILATDIDPIAVQVANENAVINGLTPDGWLEIRQESIPADKTAHFRVIVANILAEVLAGLFDGKYGNTPLAEPLVKGGKMVLSGIIEDKAEIVIEAATRHGLRLSGRKQENDWVALIFQAGES